MADSLTPPPVTWTPVRAGYYTARVNGADIEVERIGREWAVRVNGATEGYQDSMREARDSAVATARWCA